MKRIFITVAVCAIFIFTRQVLDLQFGLGLFANNLLFAQLPVQNDNDNNKDVDNDENKNDEETNPFFTQLDITDSTVKHQLDQVERLLKAERHIEAIRIVSSLLENSDDFLIPPPFHPRNINGTNVVGTNPDERTTNTTLTKRLLEILRNLPDKAKETYNLQYKSQAESLLENAIKQGSFETLQKVAKKYLPTEAGITALFFIGMYQLELGDWESALLTFDKINYTANQFNFKLDSFEPTLSLSIAACQIKLDNNNDAKLTLEKFIKKFPRPQILIGGKETWQPTNHDEIFTRIKKSVESNKVNSVASWIESSGWLLSRGVPTQNPETFASSPLLEPLWETPNFNQTNTSLFAQRLQSIVQSATETYIPALHPLVVGDLVITRGVEEITATNVNSGKRVWNQNDNNFRIPPQVLLILRNYGFGNINSPNRRNLEYGALRIKIWHDRVTNSMSSDGEKLFYVEGHSQKFSNYNRFMQQPLVIGNKTIENPLAKKSNTLTARDAKTGNLLWQVGKFNYVQKMFDKIESDIKNTNNNPNNNPNNNRNNNQPIPQFLPKIAPPQNNNAPNNNQPDDKNNDNKNEKENNVDPLFSEEELLLSETQFLGSPLPLRGNLYCICESEGLLQLFVLSASNGKLLSRVPLVQTGDRVDKDFFRNFYCLTPSASNGIIFCPTGTGMVIAVDATTVSPLWCFSYEQNPVAGKAGVGGGRRMVARMDGFGIEMNSGANNDYFRQIFGQTGWQAASIMIDGNRVLIAPPDVPSLYCVDLLTGKLLWQMTNLYRPNALYVACIYNKIAYIVTPVSMLALSMDNGRRIWEQVLSNQTANYANTANNPNFVPNNGLQIQARVVVRGGGKVLDIIPPPVVEQQIETEIADNEQTANAKNTKRPKLVFPTPLKPTGIGIHNGDLYYIPLSGGNIGVIDLVKCSIKLISSPESLAKPVEQQETLTENQTQNNIVENNSNVSFGNLIGLRGKFFSQSPLQVACFDQWFDLVERTKKLLEANADDAQGLLQLGKIKQVENNMDEAIKLFLRSFEVGRSEVAAYYLRAALMGAVKRDYKTWKHVLPKLESLALSSLEYGDILLAQAQGAAKDGDVDDFISVLKKIFDIEADFQVDVKFDNKLSSQLHNVVGLLMSQMKQEKGGDEQLQKKINQTAENIFNNFRNNNFNFSSSQNSELSNFFTQDILQSAQQLWREDDNWTSQEAKSWRTFIGLFRTMPIANDAKELLREYYMKNNLYLAAEMLTDLPSGFDIKNSGVGQDMSDVRLPKLAEVELLAKQLETQGAISDAYYYYKLIAELYGEEGKKIANGVFDRDNFKNYINANTTQNEWSKGTVNCKVENIDNYLSQSRQNNPQARATTFRNNHAHTILQIASGNRFSNNRRLISVPFLGVEEPFLSFNSYVIDIRNNMGILIAHDKSGNELWQFNLTDHLNSALLSGVNYSQVDGQITLANFTVSARFIKGCGHLLVLAVGNKMIALDTFGCGNGSDKSPRFLWSRQLTDNFNFYEKRLVNEPFSNFVIHGRNYNEGQTQLHQNEVLLGVTKNVICYRERNQLYGICLFTGDTLWTRDIQTELCSIYGDRDWLFLFDHDTFKVTAIDPFSGMELKQGFLAGNILTNYGTNVLITKINEQSKKREILVTDLRDLFLDNDNDIKLCKYEDAVPNELCRVIDVGTLPVRVIALGDKSTIKMIKHLDNIRYVSIATNNSTNGTNTFDNLFIYDLQDKSYVASKVIDGVHGGMNLSNVINDNSNVVDFQVYCNGDKFLVAFFVRTNYNRQSVRVAEEGGDKYTAQARPLYNSGVPLRTMEQESLMLFDKDGERCWRDNVMVSDGFLLQESIWDNVPVLVYASQIQTSGVNSSSRTKLFLGISVVDKISGRQRYKKNILVGQTGNIQLVKFTTDKEKNEIKLQCTDRMITIKFEKQ